MIINIIIIYLFIIINWYNDDSVFGEITKPVVVEGTQVCDTVQSPPKSVEGFTLRQEHQ